MKKIHVLKQYPREFWILLIAAFLNQSGNMAFIFLAPFFTHHLSLTLTNASFAFAMFGFSTMLSALFGGFLVDRIGAMRCMLITLILNALILIAFTFIKHYPALLIMCLIWGFVFGLFRPATQTLLTFISPPNLQKVTFSIYRWALNLGMSIGPAVGGLIAEHSYRVLYFVNAGANITAFMIILLGFMQSKWLHHHTSETLRFELSLRWLWRDKQLGLFVLALIPIAMVFFQHESTMPIFLTDYLHLPIRLYGLLFTINTLIIVFTEIPLNLATLNWSAKRSAQIGCLFIGLGFTGFCFATTISHIILLTILWTIGEMILFPAASAYVAEIAPQHIRGTYMSLYSVSFNVGLCLGPWLGGLTLGHYEPTVLWSMCGVLTILSITLLSFMPKTTNISAIHQPSTSHVPTA